MKATMKRIIDVGGSCVGLIAGAPVLAVIGILIWILDGRPVVFRQVRIGLDAKPFTLYKFRTMTNERDSGGEMLPNDMRLTWWGGFLRSTSLDELPELWNVLKGEMSLVGPRPLLPEYLHEYTDEQARRHEVCPGITGWAQVNGRNDTTWKERLERDVWYVDNHSLWLDLKILFKTFWLVVLRRDIAPEGQVTMDRFGDARD